ncbi:hypothetical protein JCM13580A_30730 [Streptomyces drozdowiczii]
MTCSPAIRKVLRVATEPKGSAVTDPAANAANQLCTISRSGQFRHAGIHFEGPIMSRRENPLEFWTSERPNGREDKPR